MYPSKTFHKTPLWLACALGLSLTACGGGGGGSTETASTSPTQTSIDGALVLGAVKGATIQVYAADDEGKKTGASLGTTTTKDDGTYSVKLNKAYTGAVVIEAEGGDYKSEADTSKTVQLSAPVTALAFVDKGTPNTVNVTPLTHMVASRVTTLVQDHDSLNVTAALVKAQRDVQSLLGDLDIEDTDVLTHLLPDFNSQTGQGYLYAYFLSTLEEGAKNTTVDSVELMRLCADDLSDNVADGKRKGVNLKHKNGANMGANLCSSGLNAAALSLAKSTTSIYANKGIDLSQASQHIASATAHSAGATGATATSSGALTYMEYYDQTGTAQKRVFVAGRADGLGILNVNDPTNTVSVTDSVLNQKIVAAGLSAVGGVIAVNNTSRPLLFLFDYSSDLVVKVDLLDQTVSKEHLNIHNSVDYSGASNVKIAGGMLDTVQGGVWLATADGLVHYDPIHMTEIARIAQPAGTRINENIGGDPSSNLILSPDYNDDGRGLIAYRLDETKAYIQDLGEWKKLVPKLSPNEPDALSMDTSYKVAVVTGEHDSNIALVYTPSLNYTAAPIPTTNTSTSTPVPVPTAGVLTVPETAIKPILLSDGVGTDCTALDISGSSVESNQHLVLFMAGNSQDLAVGLLDAPNSATGFGMTQWKSWVNGSFGPAGDPHGVGSYQLSDGRSYGFVLTDTHQVLMIDLKKFLDAPAMATCSTRLKDDPLLDQSIIKRIHY
jgi:hypothetical protein